MLFLSQAQGVTPSATKQLLFGVALPYRRLMPLFVRKLEHYNPPPRLSILSHCLQVKARLIKTAHWSNSSLLPTYPSIPKYTSIPNDSAS